MLTLDGFTASGQTYSEVYGMNRDEIVAMVGEDAARKLTMRFLRKFPQVVQYMGNRLKKQRARMMVEAMREGDVQRGNIGIRVSVKWFIFSYRGTDILIWDTEPEEGSGITEVACAFEKSQSTRNQRRVAREAIEEFKQVVQGL